MSDCLLSTGSVDDWELTIAYSCLFEFRGTYRWTWDSNKSTDDSTNTTLVCGLVSVYPAQQLTTWLGFFSSDGSAMPQDF